MNFIMIGLLLEILDRLCVRLNMYLVLGYNFCVSAQHAAVYNNRSGVLTGTSIMRRGAFSGSPLPGRMDFGAAVCSQREPPMPSQPHCGLQCSRSADSLFSSEYYLILIATHLPIPEVWKAELA